MMVAIRRLLAGLALGLVVGVWGPVVAPAFAETTVSPSPVATATATASAAGDTDAETPDVAPDNSRNIWAIGGAAAVAVLAAAVVFLRRR